MEVRPARADEIDALVDLFVRAHEGMTYLPAVPEEARPLVASRLRAHEELWVADENGRLLGFLGIERSENLGADVLERLYVEPAVQDRGVGSVLVAKAKELRPDGLHLWVFQKNEGARRFYERHGFRLVRLTDGSANMEREPDALYAWP
jgi:GNAT superfamily N-acetyltransferase